MQSIQFLDIFAVSLTIKLLLIPAYRSTDFEVHRNWLAITHSLPISKWYFEDTSIWTLDYPPFFAYFEKFLSFFAVMVDDQIVEVDNIEYASPACVYFQRITVILGELVFAYAVYKYLSVYSKRKDLLLNFLFVFLQYCYIVVDHIHFQYNTLMQGILILSVFYMRQEKYLTGAVLFAILLNFKHIYLYFAPVYFFFLLKGYCFSKTRFRVDAFIKLAGCVALVFLVSFGPFLNAEQLTQIFSRLFPWQRGLVHALWAPNFWALYCFADRILAFVGRKIFKMDISMPERSPTKGVVGEIDMALLPNVSSAVCILIILIFLLPLIRKIWRECKSQDFLKYCLYSGMTFFFFGYHVHEKAIMPQITFLQLIAAESAEYSNLALFISFNAGASLFPLLWRNDETLIQTVLILLYHIGYFLFLTLRTLKTEDAKDSSKTISKPFVIGKTEGVLIAIITVLLPIFNFIVYPRMGGFERLNWILLWVITALGNVLIYYKVFPKYSSQTAEKHV